MHTILKIINMYQMYAHFLKYFFMNIEFTGRVYEWFTFLFLYKYKTFFHLVIIVIAELYSSMVLVTGP